MRRLGFGIACVLLTGIAVTAAAGLAYGYVPYRSSTGEPYSWGVTRVEIAGYFQAVPGLTSTEVAGACTRAVATWTNANPDLGSCTYLDLHVTTQAAGATPPAVKFDRLNNITLHSDSWCTIGPDGATDCHDPAALALTTVFARSCGEILDADIEMNAVNFMWANLDATSAAAGKQDLQNALTHEMGHFIGLDHTCAVGSGQPQPLDQNGAPIPECGSAPAAVRGTTMFPSSDPDDISKRTLAPDDIAAICATYPAGAVPRQCPSPDAGAGGTSGESGGAGGSQRPVGGSGGTGIGNDGGTTAKPADGCGCGLARTTSAGTSIAWILTLALALILRAKFRLPKGG